MGSDDGDAAEQPIHEVCFEEPFWIDVYEVTNAQFGSAASNCMQWSSSDGQPHICVNWYQSIEHCEARGARLPTEAEWEYTARGPDGLVYTWGNEFIADHAVYGGNTRGQAANVGSRPSGASWIGVHDLSGSVWEWVADRYNPDYYATLSAPATNPQGPDTGDYQVLRGGSWCDNQTAALRGAARDGNAPIFQDGCVGFRCALSYED